jgi:hypothetical protein
MKFRTIDAATIDDSIQYAKIEFWRKKINASILNENEAFAWFLKVAQRYLAKEIKRLSRQCSIVNASSRSAGVDIERQFICQELLDTFARKHTKNRDSILIGHAIGYSLKDLSEAEHISLEAMKQRHSRERRVAVQKIKILFH